MLNYQSFINEKNFQETSFLDEIITLPLKIRSELKDSLKKGELTQENLNEANIFNKFTKWLRKQVLLWLINQTENEIEKTIDILTLLDPTDFSEIDSCNACYLGGGIDKTKTNSETTYWREETEAFFGEDHIIKGEDMIKLGQTGKIDKSKYPKPLILNPMRNELVRFEGDFSDAYQKWKTGKFDEIEPGSPEEEQWLRWSKKTNQTITNPDRRIIAICDTNIISANAGAGAGTWGETELTNFLGLNIFLWLNDGWNMKDISPWIIPGLTKIVRDKQEYYVLLESIKKFNQ
jgi:hypothetical protein